MSRVRLGDVCREYKATAEATDGTPIVGLEHLSQEDIDLLGYGEGPTTFTKAFRKGHVLFGRRRAYLKKASLAPCDGICSGDIIVIEADESRLFPGLLPFVIQNEYLFDFAVENSAGSLSPRVKWKDLSRFEFELPSLDEQRRIADLLWAAQDTKRCYRRLIKTCDEIVKSRFIEMFGDQKSNPYDYPTSKLGDVAFVGSSKRVFKNEIVDDGIPFYRGTEIGALAFGNDIMPELFITQSHYDELVSYTGKPEIGDLLMPSICPDGQIWLVDNESPFYFKDGRVLWVKPDRTVLDGAFLQYMLKNRFESDFESLASGTTFAELKIVVLKGLVVMEPPLSFQREFADFVHQIDKSEFALKEAMDGVTATMAAILNKELGMSDVQ